jgi:hypothetical protein
MALKDMQPSHVERIEEFALSYEWRDDPGAGFSFPCDRGGNRFPKDTSQENYDFCVAEAAKPDGKVVYCGVVDYSRDYRHPAQGTCTCGRTVYLYADYGHGIDCDCGRIYNMSGQELAPRSQWEERWDEDSTQPYWAEFGYADD